MSQNRDMGHPAPGDLASEIEVCAFPGLKIETRGTQHPYQGKLPNLFLQTGRLLARSPGRIGRKQPLISAGPAAMIHSCTVNSVVAAVYRFARRGDLGIATRSTSKVSASPRYSFRCRGFSVSAKGEK